MWDEEQDRPPMSEAEHAAVYREVKAKIARSLADPRPSLTSEKVAEHFRQRSRQARIAAGDAAA